ncbi:ParB/RepB/Spo0J family partition protein [Clostridium sp.]|uniref:ParB/RepB/Spo0J family partition protein n=1 Tax=Clostridium sp. TaxID=1506 RepID=UPI0025C1DBEF|nr:ParB/RepB/Spo0J family partition protein [Clostridium sp.]
MAKKFSISEGLLNQVSKNVKTIEELEAKDNFKVEYIDIKNIKRNEKNFYDIVNIDELAEDIKMNGLNHNLVVRKLDDNNYELISGERRYTALSKLVKEGNKIFALVPCKVIEVNYIDAEIILIQANAQTRELTEKEKLEQINKLNILYKTKKANGEKVPGRIRDIIAKDLNLSPTQVGRYERVNNNLIPELKTLLEEGNLTIANASEFASLSEENQKVILELINNQIKLNKEEAIKLKNDLKNIEDEKAAELKKLENENLEILKNNKTISDEVIKLRKELDKKENKSEEEIKQLEGQLRAELVKDINNEFSLKIEEVKQEAKSHKEEKEKLKAELEEIKSKTKDDSNFNSDEIKENFKLISELRNVSSNLVAISKQYKKMEDKKIPISNDILEALNNALMSTSILRNLESKFK